MQYSPKLKKAASEIKEILKKYDIAALVTLHTNGFAEYINEITPSYSCASFTPDGNIRVQTKGRSKEDVAATVNMISILQNVSASHFMAYDQVIKQLEMVIDFENGPGTFSSIIEQGN